MSKGTRDLVIRIVEEEMNRTDDNIDNPSRNDYLADLVRHLNNQLPTSHRFFEGDYDY